jgi:hypothetical protein
VREEGVEGGEGIGCAAEVEGAESGDGGGGHVRILAGA